MDPAVLVFDPFGFFNSCYFASFRQDSSSLVEVTVVPFNFSFGGFEDKIGAATNVNQTLRRQTQKGPLKAYWRHVDNAVTST